MTPGLLFAFVWDPKGRHKPGCSERRLSVRLSCTFNSSTCTLTPLLPLPAGDPADGGTLGAAAGPGTPVQPRTSGSFPSSQHGSLWELNIQQVHISSWLSNTGLAPAQAEGPVGEGPGLSPISPPPRPQIPAPAGGGHQGKAQRHRAGLQPRVRAGDPAPRDAGVRLSVLPGKASGGGALGSHLPGFGRGAGNIVTALSRREINYCFKKKKKTTTGLGPGAGQAARGALSSRRARGGRSAGSGAP